MSDPTRLNALIPTTEGLRRAAIEAGVDLPTDVDLKALAEEVFKLMKEELRHERERQGKP
jgi:hypothetical protein